MSAGFFHIIHRNKTRLVKAAGLLCCSLILCQAAFAQSPPSKEYKVKAVFLFNFTQFVDWPAQAFSAPGAPFVIGIVGDDPFGTAIDETVQNEKVNGHPIVVQRFHDAQDLRPCHILFISQDTPEHIKESITAAAHNTLTVSDAASFLKIGGMIRFFTESNKIRLQINPDAARASELFISSKLLRVSDIYDAKALPR